MRLTFSAVVLSHIFFPASGAHPCAPQQAVLRFAQKGRQRSAALVRAQASLLPKSRKLRMRLLFIVSGSWRFLSWQLFGACYLLLTMSQGPRFIFGWGAPLRTIWRGEK